MAQLNDPYQGKLPAKEIQKLITEFNAVPEGNHLHRIFLLHQINNFLHTVSYDAELFEWLNQPDTVDGSWEKILKVYGINPVASFFLKNYQFAHAAAQYSNAIPVNEPIDLFDALQRRDVLLLKSPANAHDIQNYANLSLYIKDMIEQVPKHRETLERHTDILAIVQDKINLIRGHIKQSPIDYKTKKLGANSNNNYNFTLETNNQKFVVRVEDRSSLKVEQKLHSYEVSKHFGDDAALFMMAMKEDGDVVYKPVVISHFANAGDLQNVARGLKGEPLPKITSTAKFYFEKLHHFCQNLKKAETYHPDIKLSNFLVHDNILRVCDRKTFVTQEKLLVKSIRSSPLYAPPQYYECATRFGLGPKAMTTEVNMDKFMSYQVGMAFKEFLILTQCKDLPSTFQDTNKSILDHFDKAKVNHALVNFDYLIKALTQREENKRLSLDYLPKLLSFILFPPQQFVNQFKIETQIPEDPHHNQISIEVNALLSEPIPLTLLEKANQLFERVAANDYFASEMVGNEVRNFATQCAQILFKGPQSYWDKYSLEKDISQASSRSRLFHFFTGGTVRVPHNTRFSSLDNKILIDSLYYQLKLSPSFEVEHNITPKDSLDLQHLLNLKLLHSELKRETGNADLTRDQFTTLLAHTGKDATEFYKAVQQVIPYQSLCSDQTAITLHDDLITLLSDKTMPPEQRLAQANKLFNKVNNECTQDNRLQWLATALATQCFQEYSLSSFKKLSKELEKKLDAENWKRASSLDKFKYYLSFGTRPVPKVSKIEELGEQLNLDAKAFLPHLLPTVFVSDKTLAFYLGHTEVEHIKQYLDTQASTFYQLLQGNSTIESQASSVNSQGTVSSVAQALTFIANTSTASNPQTVVRHTSTTNNSQNNGTVIINSSPQSQMQSANATVVIKPVSESPTTTVFLNSVTTNSTLDNNTLVIGTSVNTNTQAQSKPNQALPMPVNKVSNVRAGFHFAPKSIQETINQGDRSSLSLSSKT